MLDASTLAILIVIAVLTALLGPLIFGSHATHRGTGEGAHTVAHIRARLADERRPVTAIATQPPTTAAFREQRATRSGGAISRWRTR